MKPPPETPQASSKRQARGARWAVLSASAGALLLCGCSKVPLLSADGPTGASERLVILSAFGLMLIVVIPVIVMALWFPRRHRADNPRGGNDPQGDDPARIDTVVWVVPAVIVAVLATLTWREWHRLDPAVPIASTVAPLRVEVVSLDWKWLFIYPRQHVAAVNQLVIPANTPIDFRLTSGSVMTSFFIPRLGSQIYAMAGRQSHLYLLADMPGIYAGQNQRFRGRGFSAMRFNVVALPPHDFGSWLRETRRGRDVLDQAGLRKLSTPGAGYPVTFYSDVRPRLFEQVLNRYREPSAQAMRAMRVAHAEKPY